MELRKENYHFVLQQCEACGAQFPVIYWFKDACISPFGNACRHVSKEGASFSPVNQPTFLEWYKEQLQVRALLKAYKEKTAKQKEFENEK